MVELVPLIRIDITVSAPLEVGNVPAGYRRVIPITGGTFEGERLRGEVVPGGADWNTIRHDDVMHFWARYTLRTDDGVLIGVINEAWQPNVSTVIPIVRAGDDPGAAWCCRGNPRFEAPVGAYGWLNHATCVGMIHPPTTPGRVVIEVSQAI